MTDDELAERIVELAGGRGNLRDVDLCITRLRLVLVDPAVVDEAGIDGLPGVAMTFTQAGQFQIVLGGRVRAVHAAVRAIVDDGEHR